MIEGQSFTITRKQLSRMGKVDTFDMYVRCLNDEMSPIMWRGYTKPDIVGLFFDDDEDSVELTPFI